MTPAELYAALDLPDAARVDKRVYKKVLAERAELRPADKRAIDESARTINCTFTLKPGAIPILPYRDDLREYDEIIVVDVETTDRGAATRIAEAIHRAIPYPMLLLQWDDDGASLSAAPKRLHLQDRKRLVFDAVEATAWLDGADRTPAEAAFLNSLALSRLPQTDLYALYTAWTERILALTCATLSTRFDLPPDRPYEDRRAALEACRSLEREITKLLTTLRAEPSFARKLELNVQIKQLEATLRARTAAL